MTLGKSILLDSMSAFDERLSAFQTNGGVGIRKHVQLKLEEVKLVQSFWPVLQTQQKKKDTTLKAQQQDGKAALRQPLLYCPLGRRDMGTSSQ